MGAPTGIDRLVVFGGGYPVKIGDVAAAGIGVSDGHYSQDTEVAQAGLSAVSAVSLMAAMPDLSWPARTNACL